MIVNVMAACLLAGASSAAMALFHATDPTLNQECLDFMAICTAESLNAEECVGAMLFKCQL